MSFVFEIVSSIALILGAIGGIPQILRWLKPKPSLRITEVKVKGDGPSDYTLAFKVINKARWLRRTDDATDVRWDFFVFDKNDIQQIYHSNLILSDKLLAGRQIFRKQTFNLNFKLDQLYTIIIDLWCAEQTKTQRKIFLVLKTEGLYHT